MAVELDLADIQGNVLIAYGKLGFPKGRFMLFHIGNARFWARIRDPIVADGHHGFALEIDGTTSRPGR